MMGSLLAFLYFMLFADDGHRFWAPLFEWLATILFINFFAFVSFMNRFYDTVIPIPENTVTVSTNGTLNTSVMSNVV